MKHYKLNAKLAICLLIAFLAIFAFGQSTNSSTTNIFGELENELSPETKWLYKVSFNSVKIADKSQFPKKVRENSTFLIGPLMDPRIGNKVIASFLIERKDAMFVCVDVIADKTITDNECFELVQSKYNPTVLETVLKLPIQATRFKAIPVLLRYEKQNEGIAPNKRVLEQTIFCKATGNASFDNKNIGFAFSYDAVKNSISTTNGLLGVDLNGDGKIDRDAFSRESFYANDEEPVFRIGDKFLSTNSVDISTGRIVLKLRVANEYKRTEVIIGKELTDFSFVDLEGKKRKLSDLRGKYVLLDFWGVWCVDCRREIPFQKEAYKKFRNRGFEILGMDTDEKLQTLTDFVKTNNITWTQARFESVKDIVEKNFMIDDYPTSLLIGPDGRVLIIDQSKFKQENLSKTLEELLPK